MLFVKESRNLTIVAKNYTSELVIHGVTPYKCVRLDARFPLPDGNNHWCSENMTSVPQAFANAAEASQIGLTIFNGMIEKLRAQGYSIGVTDRMGHPLSTPAKNSVHYDIFGMTRMGKSHEHEIFPFNNIQSAMGRFYADICVDRGYKVDGLQEAIQNAYDEVLRENKAVAAYMSKGQSAKLGV